MSNHSNANQSEYPNVAALLEKLASQPNGLETALKLLTILTPQSEHQLKPETGNHKRLIAIALQLVNEKGIKHPPYFKDMSDDAIRKFIAQHSLKSEVN